MLDEDKTPIVRRQIVKEITDGSFSTIALMHMSHYDRAADLIIRESVRLGRPIDVVNVGAGDLWDLHVLNHGMKVDKKKILRSYTAIDIESRPSPFGKKLSEYIKFESLVKDLEADPNLPVHDETADVIICTEFIEHVHKHQGDNIIQEMNFVLRPGGLLYLTTPNTDNTTRTDKYHLHEYSLSELYEVMESNGFEIESYYGTYIDVRTFNKVNAELKRIPDELLEIVRTRFTNNFFRIFCATPYPEYSNGIAIHARKPDGISN